jgi:hypothetical protein
MVKVKYAQSEIMSAQAKDMDVMLTKNRIYDNELCVCVCVNVCVCVCVGRGGGTPFSHGEFH